MRILFRVSVVLLIFLGCSGNQSIQSDKKVVDTMTPNPLDSTAIVAVMQKFYPKSNIVHSASITDFENNVFFIVTYSPECPICIGSIGELRRIVRWIDSLGKENVLNRLVVLVEQPLSHQYQWLQSFVVQDSAFVLAKKLGFNVYPELKIINKGKIRYSGKLNNRAKKIGEKSLVNRSSDSSYIWNQWLNCHHNQNSFYPINEAVGCYIE